MKKAAHPMVIGNWKMNPQSVSHAARLAKEVKKGVARIKEVEVVIAPPLVFMPEVAKIRNGSKLFALAAQNVHHEKLGAHTGEVSLPMLKDFGVEYIILGHSERRAAGESNDDVNKKIHAVLKAGLVAVVCIGEKERDHGAGYLNFVEEQIRKAAAGVSKAKLGNFVFAYEPIWAIGTGLTALPEDVHEMKLFIQKVLTDMYGRNYAGKVKILYGGSVKPKNAPELTAGGMMDGFLVGGASLSAKDFIAVVKAAKAE